MLISWYHIGTMIHLKISNGYQWALYFDKWCREKRKRGYCHQEMCNSDFRGPQCHKTLNIVRRYLKCVGTHLWILHCCHFSEDLPGNIGCRLQSLIMTLDHTSASGEKWEVFILCMPWGVPEHFLMSFEHVSTPSVGHRNVGYMSQHT